MSFVFVKIHITIKLYCQFLVERLDRAGIQLQGIKDDMRYLHHSPDMSRIRPLIRELYTGFFIFRFQSAAGVISALCQRTAA